MKQLYFLLALLVTTLVFAQTPQGFNYQATVRDNSGELVVNQNVYFKFNVIQGSQTRVPVYIETHYASTDDLGQVGLVIGEGTATTGVFSEIDWSLGNYFLGIELDNGSGYVAMGTTQMLSVPYALYAESSGNATTQTPNLETILAENNSANNQQIKNLADPTDDQDAVTKAYTYSKAEVDALVADLQNQIDDINRLSESDTPFVLVLIQGRPRFITSVEEKADAILYAGLPGFQGAEAIANVISGTVNPSGKLPFSYPENSGHFTTYNHKPSANYDFDEESANQISQVSLPTSLYPFGHGLSYTKFEYSDLKLSNGKAVSKWIE